MRLFLYLNSDTEILIMLEVSHQMFVWWRRDQSSAHKSRLTANVVLVLLSTGDAYTLKQILHCRQKKELLCKAWEKK